MRRPSTAPDRKDGDLFVPRAPEMMPKRSQDLAPAFFDAGQFYWARAATWQDETTSLYDGAAGVILPDERAVDFDTEAEWERVERLACVDAPCFAGMIFDLWAGSSIGRVSGL